VIALQTSRVQFEIYKQDIEVNFMNLSELIFNYLDEFFLQESMGKAFHTSNSCQKKRWEICESCVHYDEPEEGCKHCGCYLPHKIKDPFGSCPLEKWISDSEQWNEEHFDFIKNELIKRCPELEDELNGIN
jgi:hypothetical protein